MLDQRKAFVVGFPIHHSLSPFIHKFWLDMYKIDGTYQAQQVTVEDFPSFIKSLEKNGFVGGNVTLPHKEQAFRLAQYCDASARAIGAANSLWFEKGILCASNSDAYGFSLNLTDFAPQWQMGEIALVLGAGGAARAVIFALKQQGFKTIFLANRTRERAETLATYFGSAIKIIDWEKINDHIAVSDLIINTTSIGLTEDQTIYPFDFTRADAQAIVTDIVYHPIQTPFLQAAEHQGLKIVDGLGMLLHQAVFGFERWFGVKPVVSEELRHFIVKKLTA